VPSKEWQGIFREVRNRTGPNGFDYDDLETAARALGADVKRSSLRTKMMNYVNAGHVERIGDGRFNLTHSGFAHFKIGAPVLDAKASPEDDDDGYELVGRPPATSFASDLDDDIPF
jgi:hypothetical protein